MILDETKIKTFIENVRRLKSKHWNRHTPNWAVVVAVAGCGSNTAHEACRNNGVDPDAYES